MQYNIRCTTKSKLKLQAEIALAKGHSGNFLLTNIEVITKVLTEYNNNNVGRKNNMSCCYPKSEGKL